MGPAFPTEAEIKSLGKPDLNWSVRTLDGREIRLTDLRGKVLFLNFWATWCGPCVAELPSIERLSTAMSGSEVAFLLISQEDQGRVQQFAEAREFQLPFCVAQGKVPESFVTDAIPATFILNRHGEIVFQHIGSANWDSEESRRFLQLLLK